MGIRLITIELLTGLIILAVLAHTIFSPSLKEFLIRGTLFIFVSISGTLLVRNTLKILRQKEKINIILEQKVKQRTKALEKAKAKEIREKKEELERLLQTTAGRELKMLELKKQIKALAEQHSMGSQNYL